MPRATCPSRQDDRNFTQRSPVITGTLNGHDVALVPCDACGFAVMAYYAPRNFEILHHFPRDVRCMNCDQALRRQAAGRQGSCRAVQQHDQNGGLPPEPPAKGALRGLSALQVQPHVVEIASCAA